MIKQVPKSFLFFIFSLKNIDAKIKVQIYVMDVNGKTIL